MSYPQAQIMGYATQLDGTGDYRFQTNPSMPGKTVCPYEEHVVTDPNVSRIVLMIMRDFVSRKALYDRAEDERAMFCCPIMRCYEEFDQPMGLIGHLLECKQLKFGEFNCLRCKNAHRYPITEREWLEWEGWQAKAPAVGIKKKFSELSGSIFRVIRSQRRNSAPSSRGGSPSAAAKSPGPPDWIWSGTGHLTVQDKLSLHGLPDQERTEYIADAPYELQATSSTSVELPETPPPPSYRQNSPGSFASSQTSSSRSGSSPQVIFDVPGTSWDSPTSSFGSSQIAAPEIQILAQPGSVRYFDNLTQSPGGMSVDQAGGQPVWELTPTTSGYTEETASGINAFVPTPDSSRTAAEYFPISDINVSPASNTISTWNPDDGSLYSWLQGQMPPPPPPPQGHHSGLADMLPNISTANVGAIAHCLQAPDQIPVHEQLNCGGRSGNYTCEWCPWQPMETGKPENFANYLRKHRQTHLGRRFYCPNAGCERSYSRPDNLSKHIKESHPNSVGAYGSPSSQTRSGNKRRFTSSSTR
ncbi:hypothetical protein RB601_001400 [Gaeumannomyces tritici]